MAEFLNDLSEDSADANNYKLHKSQKAAAVNQENIEFNNDHDRSATLEDDSNFQFQQSSQVQIAGSGLINKTLSTRHTQAAQSMVNTASKSKSASFKKTEDDPSEENRISAFGPIVELAPKVPHGKQAVPVSPRKSSDSLDEESSLRSPSLP